MLKRKKVGEYAGKDKRILERPFFGSIVPAVSSFFICIFAICMFCLISYTSASACSEHPWGGEGVACNIGPHTASDFYTKGSILQYSVQENDHLKYYSYVIPEDGYYVAVTTKTDMLGGINGDIYCEPDCSHWYGSCQPPAPTQVGWDAIVATPTAQASWSYEIWGGECVIYGTASSTYQIYAKFLARSNTDTNDTGDPCNNSVPAESSANLASGNLYHSQKVAGLAFSYNSIDPYSGPLGKGWTHNFNLSITPQSNGTLLLKTGDGNNFYFSLAIGIYTPAAGNGDTSTIVANTGGSYTRTQKNGIVQTFNSVGNLTSITDRDGRTATLAYSGGNLTSVTDPNGRVTIFTSSSNKITSITTPNGGVYTLAYSGEYLSSITDPLGNAWQYTYNSNGNMLTKTDPLGNLVSYTYDSTGRLLTSTDPEGKTRAMNYTQSGNTSFTEKDGGVWTYTYDTTLLAKTQKIDPLGNITKYAYDLNRNLISETAPDNSVTAYAYDANSNLTSLTDPQGNKTSYTYNSLNLVTSITDPKTVVTSLTYDAKGNLTKITDPLGGSRTLQYDAKGNVISLTDPKGAVTSFAYDAQNNLTSIKDSLGNITSFTYDAAGNRLTMTDPLANVTHYAYNSLNQMTQVTDPKGNITRFTYDYKGNVLTTTDANNNPTNYAYNYRGQVTQITDALNNITRLNYGATGCSGGCNGGAEKLTALTDALNNITSYSYDLLGRLSTETDPIGNVNSYQYDVKSNLTKKTRPDGTNIVYTYDLASRLIQKTYPDGNVAAFQYDQVGNMTYAGNQHIAYNMVYDANRRLSSITDSNGRVIKYTYDSLGNRTQLTYPDNTKVNYAYDTASRLTGIATLQGTLGTLNWTYAYDSLSRRTKQTNPNGTSANYAYDQASGLTSLINTFSTGAVISGYNYTLDNVGNRLTKADQNEQINYTYDAVYQLTQAQPTASAHETYSYDAVGNRLIGPKPHRKYTYDHANQLVTENKQQFQHDVHGNLIQHINGTTTFSYTYDYENRLVQAEKNANGIITMAQYKYDPFGRRIEKSVTKDGDTDTTKYVYDGASIIAEYDETNALGNRYIQGLGIDEPLAVLKNKNVHYYHADGLGSITALTDKKQNVDERFEYDSFGKMTHTGSVDQPYAFTGREWDKEMGMYYYRARYYDEKTGRFITKDPMGFGGGDVNLYRMTDSVGKPAPVVNPYWYVDSVGKPWPLTSMGQFIGNSLMLQSNLYIYAANNPINNTDSSGMILDNIKCFYYMTKCAQEALKCKEKMEKESKCDPDNVDKTPTSDKLFKECWQGTPACQKQIEACGSYVLSP